MILNRVVLDTTKVQIFKQITTLYYQTKNFGQLFQIPQRYRFSSKSQQDGNCAVVTRGCFRYHKGTDFQANHNIQVPRIYRVQVVLDTTKVQIFKQITTELDWSSQDSRLFQIPQRYRFSSKSQPTPDKFFADVSCFRYHKGTDFQANHNLSLCITIRF